MVRIIASPELLKPDVGLDIVGRILCMNTGHEAKWKILATLFLRCIQQESRI